MNADRLAKAVLFFFVTIVLLFVTMVLPGFSDHVAAAQSTGDTLHLPTRTPAPPPTAAPTFSPTPPPQTVWLGRVVNNVPQATEGQGSIFRVSVLGLPDTPIELRSGDAFITANSGSKPEYGPFAAEFAPVTEGTWTVSVPALGVSLQVAADNYNLAIIEFAQVPQTEATQAARPSATATPFAGEIWAGRVVSQDNAGGIPFSRLLVQVVGRDEQSVQLSTLSQILSVGKTGQKPDELGPNMVEFAGLTPGDYFIDLLGRNATLAVVLKPNVVTRVEFTLQTPTATPLPSATSTSSPPPPPPTATAQPTITPLPTDTPPPPPTVPPLPTATPVFTPTPVLLWLGTVDARIPQNAPPGTLTVQIAGIEGMAVRLNRLDSGYFAEQRCVTGQDQQGQDVCRFQNLQPGWYTVSPEGIDQSLPVQVADRQQVRVRFTLESLPPGITGWQAVVRSNSNGFAARPRTDGKLRVKVAGRRGMIVSLTSARLGVTHYCETVPNPVQGANLCEFGQLGPGIYRVAVLHTGAEQSVFVDGAGEVDLEFLPNATFAIQSLLQSAPVVGRGATPRQATVTPLPTAMRTPAVVQPAVALPTPTLTPAPTFTPTPVFGWQGRVVETTVAGVGTIGVRAAGLKDHPVVLHSGSWQSDPQPTGTKPELGDYATEFGGLPPGEYVVELIGLATFNITLDGGQFVLVEFRFDRLD